MKHLQQLIVAALLLTVCSGCILTPRSSKETTYYDLANPQSAQSANVLHIGSVENATSAQSRMFFRLQDNRIVQDSLNCWIQPPENMLKRYFDQRFKLTGNIDTAKLVDLRCTINAFEFDMIKSEATVSVKCIFRQDNKRQIAQVTASEKITSRQPHELAKAMNVAVEKLSKKIAAIAENLHKSSK